MKAFYYLILLINISCSSEPNKLNLEDILKVQCSGEEILLPNNKLFGENQFHGYSISFYHESRDFAQWDTSKPKILELYKIQSEFERIRKSREYKSNTTSKPLEIRSEQIIIEKPENFKTNDTNAYYFFQCVPLVYKEYEYRQFSIYNSDGINSYLIGIYLKNGVIIKCFKTNPINFKALDFNDIDDYI